MSAVLLENALLVTVDQAMTVHDRGWLEVGPDGAIADLGPGDPAPDRRAAAAEVIDCAGDVVMPGFVNTHAHLAMTLFRGLGEDVEDRLFRYILPLERRFVTAEAVRAGTALAAVETIEAGVTTVADMYYFEDVVGGVLAEAGLRALVGQTIADFDPPDHADVDEGFARLDALCEAFAGHPLITPTAAPHAPYSTGLAVMERVARWASDHPGLPVQMHLAETDHEIAWAMENHYRSPVATVEDAGLLSPALIAAHCLHVGDADIASMAAAGVGVATNPRSNGKAGRGIAPVEAMRQSGIAVGLGTDGPMSGNTLDLFAQFAPVSMFAKLLGRSRAPLPAREVIRMATIDGARALKLQDRIGSLEPGKRADLVRIDLAAARLHPVYDVYSMLVFAALPTDVRDVMVDGRWLMRDRSLLTADRRKALRDALQVAAGFKAEMARIDAETGT